jgi:flagellar biogenesis protein FliO
MKRFLCMFFCAAVICSAPFLYKHISHGEVPLFKGHGERQSHRHQKWTLEEAIRSDGTKRNPITGELASEKPATDDDGDAAVEQAPVGNEHLEGTVAKICIGTAILMLLWGAVSTMRRRRYDRFGGDGKSAIQLVSRLSLGQKHYLAVVSCEQKRFLIGITQNGIGRIGSLGEGPLRVVQKSASTGEKTA